MPTLQSQGKETHWAVLSTQKAQLAEEASMLEWVGGWEISRSTVHDCFALNLGPSATSHSETQIKAATILRTFVLKYQSTVKQRRKVSEVYLAGNLPNIRFPNTCLETLKNLCSLTCIRSKGNYLKMWSTQSKITKLAISIYYKCNEFQIIYSDTLFN